MEIQPGHQVLCSLTKSSVWPCWVYTPPDFLSKPSWPLLLVLHGAGESGTDPVEMMSDGATDMPFVCLQDSHLAKADERLKTQFVVVSPQTNSGWQKDRLDSFMSFLLEGGLRLDPARLYVTGVSMGGGGAVAAARTGRFAAAVPVCPAARDASGVPTDVDVWLFHGKNDRVVPSTASDRIDAGLRQARKGHSRAGEVRYTLYPTSPNPVGWPQSTGHASWMQAYNETELWPWVLAKTKAATA